MVAAIAWPLAVLLAVVLVAGSLGKVLSIRNPYIRPFDGETRDAYVAIALMILAAVIAALVSAGQLSVKGFEVAGVKGEVVQLKSDVQEVKQKVITLGEQLEELYASRITELFDDKNWSELHFDRTKGPPQRRDDPLYRVTIKLRAEPIPGSLQVTRGFQSVTPDLISLEGRTLRFITYARTFGQDYPDPIVVTYHPRQRGEPQ
jgi:hypothetical protein